MESLVSRLLYRDAAFRRKASYEEDLDAFSEYYATKWEACYYGKYQWISCCGRSAWCQTISYSLQNHVLCGLYLESDLLLQVFQYCILDMKAYIRLMTCCDEYVSRTCYLPRLHLPVERDWPNQVSWHYGLSLKTRLFRKINAQFVTQTITFRKNDRIPITGTGLERRCGTLQSLSLWIFVKHNWAWTDRSWQWRTRHWYTHSNE